ncbi:hypothetical protein ADUPG1_006698, partial [Aduncisulcus paluster]
MKSNYQSTLDRTFLIASNNLLGQDSLTSNQLISNISGTLYFSYYQLNEDTNNDWEKLELTVTWAGGTVVISDDYLEYSGDGSTTSTRTISGPTSGEVENLYVDLEFSASNTMYHCVITMIKLVLSYDVVTCSSGLYGSSCQYVTISDSNLHAAVCSALSISDSSRDIPLNSFQNLTSLNAASQSITNLSGMSFASSLTSLNLSGNALSTGSLSNISSLSSLRTLSLSSCTNFTDPANIP